MEPGPACLSAASAWTARPGARHAPASGHGTTPQPLPPRSAAPHFAPGGEILYSGADLKQGGVLSYYHDLLYLAIFAQLGGVVTWWAWLAFLAVRAVCGEGGGREVVSR